MRLLPQPADSLAWRFCISPDSSGWCPSAWAAGCGGALFAIQRPVVAADDPRLCDPGGASDLGDFWRHAERRLAIGLAGAGDPLARSRMARSTAANRSGAVPVALPDCLPRHERRRATRRAGEACARDHIVRSHYPFRQRAGSAVDWLVANLFRSTARADRKTTQTSRSCGDCKRRACPRGRRGISALRGSRPKAAESTGGTSARRPPLASLAWQAFSRFRNSIAARRPSAEKYSLMPHCASSLRGCLVRLSASRRITSASAAQSRHGRLLRQPLMKSSPAPLRQICPHTDWVAVGAGIARLTPIYAVSGQSFPPRILALPCPLTHEYNRSFPVGGRDTILLSRHGSIQHGKLNGCQIPAYVGALMPARCVPLTSGFGAC